MRAQAKRFRFPVRAATTAVLRLVLRHARKTALKIMVLGCVVHVMVVVQSLVCLVANKLVETS